LFLIRRPGNHPDVSDLQPDDVLLLFVSTRTSGVGRRMEPVIANFWMRNRDRLSVRRVDADTQSELVRRLGVRSVPTLVFVRDRRPVTRLEGRASVKQLEQVLAEI
jgi:thioredoxin-like negative regulator of GroEL